MSDLTPLSSDQERLWLRRYLFPEWGNESPAVVWLGPLPPAAVQAACTALVRRHPALRTVYPTSEGVPAQRVLPASRFAVSLVDLTALPEPQRRAALARVVAAEADRPFELDTGPVLRVELVRLSRHEHVLVSGVHHIAVDPWSIVLLGEDLMALGAAAASGLPDPRTPVTTTYLDYVAWLRERRDARAAETDRRFWRERLAGIADVELPLDRPRPRRLTTEVLVHAVDLPAEVSELLRETARAAGVTTFVALLTCFTALVRRWSGASRFAVMTVPSGRLRTEFASVVGLFTGDVVVCCDASGDPTVGELLVRTRDAVLDTFEHPEPAFNELAAGLDPERALTPHPLRQLGLVLHNRRPPEADLTRADLPVAPISRGNATADIWLDVFDSGSGPMRMRLEMAEPIFEVRTGQLTAERLITLVRSAMADTGQPISALPLVGPVEADLVAEWSAAAGADHPEPIADALARGAARNPHGIAIALGEHQITHVDLHSRVQAAASSLGSRGIGPGTVVRVDGGDRVAVVIAALAVLHAGGGVVIDRSDDAPEGARLRFRTAHRPGRPAEAGGFTPASMADMARVVGRRLRPDGAPLRVAQPAPEDLDVIAILAAVRSGGTVVLDAHPQPDVVWLVDSLSPAAAGRARPAGAEVWIRHRPAGSPVWIAAIPLPEDGDRGRLPLGRPLGLVEFDVVDQRGRQVPVGRAGELRLAGPARPSSMWPTGRRVLFDHDGVLWPAADDRFPATGGRWVDLAAVERALREHPKVAAAAVALRRCRTRADVSVTRLVCWVRPAGSAGLADQDHADLAALLAGVTAVPHTVVVDDLSPDESGHVDTSRLPTPVLGDRPSGGAPAPATPTEAAVAELYGELLDVTDVGRHDSFFVLGGTSMQVCRLGARIAGRFGVHLPLYDLVLRSRVVDVAAAVDAALGAGPAQHPGSHLRTASTTGETSMSDRQRG